MLLCWAIVVRRGAASRRLPLPHRDADVSSHHFVAAASQSVTVIGRSYGDNGHSRSAFVSSDPTERNSGTSPRCRKLRSIPSRGGENHLRLDASIRLNFYFRFLVKLPGYPREQHGTANKISNYKLRIFRPPSPSYNLRDVGPYPLKWTRRGIGVVVGYRHIQLTVVVPQ